MKKFGTLLFLQHIAIKIIALGLILVGIAGLFLPIIPGLFFLFTGISLLGLYHGHKRFWPK